MTTAVCFQSWSAQTDDEVNDDDAFPLLNSKTAGAQGGR